ncbi:MAG: FtsB family cell division protein [Acidimicrobiia bacterium]
MTETLERTSERPARSKRRGSRWRSMAFIVLLVSLGLVATGVLPVQQFLERETQVNDAQARLDALVEDNTALEDQATALLSDQEIERIAREQYGYVREGEIGYVVTTPDGEDIPSSPPQPVPVETDGRGFLEKIWDFITGSDATGNG